MRPARKALAAIGAVTLGLLIPAIALAHPLGNFTINHFAALRVAPDRISLDVVIDRAEIPAFQEQQRLDRDADGVLSAPELAGQAEAGCRSLSSDLRLSIGGAPVFAALDAAGLSLPAGAGGLPTMRLVCQYSAGLPAAIVSETNVAFEDRSFAERLGWREIVLVGDGLLVDGRASTDGAAAGASARLTAYPEDLLAQPLEIRSVTASLAPGGVALAAWMAPDAEPLGTPGDGTSGGVVPSAGPALPGVVPGGITEDLAAIVDVNDLTPLAILISLTVAIGLGIVHALSPGHGKTIMAAYLVGSGGSSRQAIGLGMAVAVSHTLGVLALAAVALGASSFIPPERLYPILGVVSGAIVIALGASLLWSRLKSIRDDRADARAQRADHDHPHEPAHAAGFGQEHDPAHEDGHRHGHDHDHGHSHEPQGTVSWRGMLALGLSGGLVPSVSALILLLGSIAAGRVAYGLVLVLGFGVGMAIVLMGIGLLIVHARRLVERRPSTAALHAFAGPVQLATASLVVILGIVLTGQALTQIL